MSPSPAPAPQTPPPSETKTRPSTPTVPNETGPHSPRDVDDWKPSTKNNG